MHILMVFLHFIAKETWEENASDFYFQKNRYG